MHTIQPNKRPSEIRNVQKKTGSLPSVLITGANGHIGRALTELLQDQPFQSIGLTRKPLELRADHVVCGPMDSPSAMAAIHHADMIVHLAGVSTFDIRPTRLTSVWSLPFLSIRGKNAGDCLV